MVGICQFHYNYVILLVSNGRDFGVIRLASFKFEFDVVEVHVTVYIELHSDVKLKRT